MYAKQAARSVNNDAEALLSDTTKLADLYEGSGKSRLPLWTAIFFALLALGLAGLGVLSLVILNLSGVRRLAPYLLIGVAIWVCVLKSGIHATLAGVAVALLIPRGEGEHGPLRLDVLHVYADTALGNSGLRVPSGLSR